ncbi:MULTISPECIES: 1,6-dihydroxycyclohexa-2,4-diene-1-carboxylate dehydrogenase [unclassified Oceanobacter]|jgi:dihydroxycyclohexadiene carboxylate dehydrogenase|uniref:1,6-dihydroxycyclohexa-2,4-diene-1-carboxylate dehydrogenase n=1 Tax=unclassified Oceanobacter TaxID=2620260 RepID=UPI0026E3E69A|nr:MULTISPECIES: 1,6-dihydroxycyclohexa-2,4-diene-1-carboxylate dehydrogenase [unclassified Oceanobacter]MDO6682663.1 1,6-dihydroxycyclohexa-2,4-diene-1-carboxylate dehydrogenase [Oceanobacter sp. 5_MG-2023]MDP2505834.1 1,6-dihydroxycyclohexa-2,4-diene-1-carboxylate dehydrogenase [Oceanobacter sp. 3_MG-2023]MDP2548425.1 1,6-dihydroxycyclohexa-2,4-diene-1-carboxylate dehydrogenase [Oceanobacter sp. 4_MG-2023]MDP2609128.1 1,6-dihydroxycyclohexa-2,4-diene-1-carboxylate dehydrogenase [Oceanobacter 
MRPSRFENKVVIVTGAAQGIGRTVAESLAAEGAILALIDLSPIVEEVVAACLAAGSPNTIHRLANLEQFKSANDAIRSVIAELGRVDVLVNNVGGTIWAKPYEAYKPTQIEKEIRRSLFPTLWGCHAVLDTMQAQRSGTIVNVSSIATRSRNRVPYAAAKGGVNAITACLAFENAEYGIRVNATAPGGTDAAPRRIPRNTNKQSKQEAIWYQQIVDQTVDSTLMKRYSTLQEQADAILFLASDESSYLTGSVIPVGGGDLG